MSHAKSALTTLLVGTLLLCILHWESKECQAADIRLRRILHQIDCKSADAISHPGCLEGPPVVTEAEDVTSKNDNVDLDCHPGDPCSDSDSPGGITNIILESCTQTSRSLVNATDVTPDCGGDNGTTLAGGNQTEDPTNRPLEIIDAAGGTGDGNKGGGGGNNPQGSGSSSGSSESSSGASGSGSSGESQSSSSPSSSSAAQEGDGAVPPNEKDRFDLQEEEPPMQPSPFQDQLNPDMPGDMNGERTSLYTLSKTLVPDRPEMRHKSAEEERTIGEDAAAQLSDGPPVGVQYSSAAEGTVNVEGGPKSKFTVQHSSQTEGNPLLLLETRSRRRRRREGNGDKKGVRETKAGAPLDYKPSEDGVDGPESSYTEGNLGLFPQTDQSSDPVSGGTESASASSSPASQGKKSSGSASSMKSSSGSASAMGTSLESAGANNSSSSSSSSKQRHQAKVEDKSFSADEEGGSDKPTSEKGSPSAGSSARSRENSIDEESPPQCESDEATRDGDECERPPNGVPPSDSSPVLQFPTSCGGSCTLDTSREGDSSEKGVEYAEKVEVSAEISPELIGGAGADGKIAAQCC